MPTSPVPVSVILPFLVATRSTMANPMDPNQRAPIDLTTDSPPDWTQQGATTPPAASTCAICLIEIDPQGDQHERAHWWPGCEHPLHLGCALQYIARQPRPACPTCRRPWTQAAGRHLEQSRQDNNLDWPIPETPMETSVPSTRPPPPTNILPLCCPRLALIDPRQPDRDASWRELPSRHMDWAPTYDQRSGEWQAEWVCLRCDTHITATHPSIQHDQPPPQCSTHGPRQLAIDYRNRERGWVCSTGYPPQ